jgi:hypothetical protein
MTRLFRSILIATLALVAAPSWPYPDPGDAVRAQAFVKHALAGIGAQATECPAELLEAIASRQMVARCATFDGSFDTFRDLWAEWTVGAEPRTAWSVSGVGLNYDRVYALGRSAMGVRFTHGEILIVLK